MQQEMTEAENGVGKRLTSHFFHHVLKNPNACYVSGFSEI